MPLETSLVTVDLEIGSCGSAGKLRLVGGTVRRIRGVVCVKPARDGRRLRVSYVRGKVMPLQFERAVRSMGGRLDSIEFLPECALDQPI